MLESTFTLFGLQMSFVEAVGAVVGIIYLVLEYKANAWLWLFGLLMPLFYIYLFFKNTLYANAAINIYYVAASVYGLLCWRGLIGSKGQGESPITSMPKGLWLPLAAIVLGLAGLLGWLLGYLGESQAALLDGFTSALSVVGMWMLAKGYYQQWLCWIVVEPVMVVMSIITGMYPTAVMYLVYCVIAVMGYLRWKRQYDSQSPNNNS